MTDKTAEIQELAEAYQANRVAKATIRAEVKEKYRAIIAEEIRERQTENDVRFAKRLERVKELAGLTLRDIQDGVLRTRTWSVWEYWRDLAGMAPERVSVSLARDAEHEERKPYRIEDGKVVVTRNEHGPIEEFALIGVGWNEADQKFISWPPMAPGEPGEESFRENFESVSHLTNFLNAAYAEYGDTPNEY